ncbi:thiamine diphosphokinase [Numidum massiliense]|uniref:thiamine diphosphokinase n=1 Tax=Numidum massiliense TaxID=1522315 RepID=UPI0006D56C50|nr:thiamine diphosphokinase [Numidum massiliense]
MGERMMMSERIAMDMSKSERRGRVVIATGGSWGATEHLIIRPDDVVIGVDGGIVELMERDVPMTLAVGDFDTAPPEQIEELRAHNVPTLRLPVDKDVTDTDYAVTKALEWAPQEVVLLGGWGSRWDHTLANVCLLERLLQAGVRGVMQNEHNRMQLVGPGTVHVAKEAYTYMSLIAWRETVTGITLEGFRFPLVDASLARTSNLSISNEWQGESGTVTHRRGELLIVQSRDPL